MSRLLALASCFMRDRDDPAGAAEGGAVMTDQSTVTDNKCQCAQTIDTCNSVTDNKCLDGGPIDNRNAETVTDNNLVSAPPFINRNKPIDEWMCRRSLALIAKRTAWHCGSCGTAIPAGAPVWRSKVLVGKWGKYWLSVVCRDCSRSKADPVDQCIQCGRGVGGRSSIMRQHIYCSDHCDSLHHAAIQRQKRTDARGTCDCDSCGEAFTPKRADSKYCSSKCRQKAYRQRHD